MNTTTPVPCTACGQPDDLRCACFHRTEQIAAGVPSADPDPDAPAAGLVLAVIAPLRAGYYVIDRP